MSLEGSAARQRRGKTIRGAIALDAMGSDLRPVAEILGAADAVRRAGIDVVLVGDRGLLEREMDRLGARGLMRVGHAPDCVDMGESPVEALRRKPRSSLRVALEMVRSGEVVGMVSAGNTGALLVSAAAILGRIEGVDRPALAVELPTLARPALLCDAGANSVCRPAHLLGFARLASCASAVASGRDEPRVGLLSNGAEERKGNDLTRAARMLLERSGLNFVGYVEPQDLPEGHVDVVVSDGFAGNILLKTMEATAQVAFGMMRRAFRASVPAGIGYLLARRSLRRRLTVPLDYGERGGAPLLGVNGLVLSLHGRSEACAIRTALCQAAELAASGLVDALRFMAAEPAAVRAAV